jgi:hypothetical protein
MNLDDHIAALRATADGDDAALAHETRLRIRRSLDEHHAPVRLPGIVAALAILLLATASWALATGQVQKLLRRAEPVLEQPPSYGAAEPPAKPSAPTAPTGVDREVVPPTPMHASPADETAAPATTDVAALNAAPAPAPANVHPALDTARVVARNVHEDPPLTADMPHARATGPVLGEAPMTTPPRQTIEHAPVETLYREAHELHFHGNDPAAALAAWDRYLAAEPTGRFAVEARYNRALCLVRLGRLDDARTALQPFADGNVEPAGYRQSEAQALVDRIARRR